MADTTLKLLLLGEDRSASKTLKGVGDEAGRTATKTKTAGSVMKGALGAGIVMEGARAVYDFGKSSVEAFVGASASQRKLEDAYKRFPAVQNVSIDRQRELNQAIQDKTGADADDIAGAQAKLAAYKLDGTQISALTPLMVDYAKRTGKDMPAAGAALGKAIMGNGRAMKELGINFKDTGDPAKNLQQIMAGLQEKVGGFAEGEASTLEGKLSIMQAKFGDVQEEIGGQLLPVLMQLADGAAVLVGWISQNASWLGPLAAGLGIAAGAMVLLNVAMTANPIGIVVVAIGALVGALIYAYQNSESFRAAVDGAFRAVGAAGTWLWNSALAPALRGIVTGFAWVVDGIAGMLGALGTIPGFEWARDAAVNLKGMAADARNAAAGIKDIPPAADVKVTFDAPGANATAAEVKAVSAAVKAVPGSAKTQILAPGARPSKAAVDSFMSSLRGVPKEKRAAIKTVAQLGGINAAKAAVKSLKDKAAKVTVNANAKPATDTGKAIDKIPKAKTATVTTKATTKPATDLKSKLDAIKSKTVSVTVNVRKTGISSISISGTGGSVRYTIRAAARGGIFRPMAAGGFAGARIFSQADGVMFNEPDTKGESYIPLADDWRRPGAVSVWQKTGRLLGQMAGGGIVGRPGSSGTAGGDVYNISANVARGVDPLSFAREVEAALVSLKSRNRKLAFQGV